MGTHVNTAALRQAATASVAANAGVAAAPAQRVAALDGLRGLSVLGVMLFHAELLPGAFYALDLFFVLSGLLITRLLLLEFERDHRIDLRLFYLRRALRLLPALMLVCAVLVAVSAVQAPALFSAMWKESVIALLYLSNWTRALGMHPPEWLGHTWSLSTEEQYYALWPLLLVLCLKRGRSLAFIGGLCVTLMLAVWAQRGYLLWADAPANRLYNGLDTRADGLMLGSGLAVLMTLGDRTPRWLNAAKTFGRRLTPLALLLSAMLWAAGRWDAAWTFAFGLTLANLCAAALILGALDTGGLWAQAWSHRALAWLGTLSYGIYLWHYPIFKWMLAWSWPGPWVLVLGGAASLACAAASYYLMERPLLRLKARFERARFLAAGPEGQS
jgi:peptidoglycan/LPS O-acetylase OafA/YrhL